MKKAVATSRELGLSEAIVALPHLTIFLLHTELYVLTVYVLTYPSTPLYIAPRNVRKPTSYV